MRAENIDLLHLGTRMKRFKAFHVDEALILLNHAVRSRLPVPEGIVLLDNGWERLIQDGIVILDGADVHIHAADAFLKRFALNRLSQPITIRPFFTTKTITLPPDDNHAIIHALIEQWSLPNISKRRDILVSKAVTPKQFGTALTSCNDSTDIIHINNTTLSLPHFSRSAPNRLAWQHRLQLLLRGIRHSFNLQGDEWYVEWIDDGHCCWLLYITPHES